MRQLIDGGLEENAGFILYNHLYRRKGVTFTIKDIADELKQEDMEISSEIIEREVDGFVSDGLVERGIDDYTCVAI